MAGLRKNGYRRSTAMVHEVMLSLTEYERAILKDLLSEAVAESRTFAAKAGIQSILAPIDAASAQPQPGDKMPDGAVYAGISPYTGRAMYAMPSDASLTMTFNQARDYAARLDAHRHRDWRVPTKNGLDILFNSRAAIGRFNRLVPIPQAW
jgi:hypothetical protein